MILRVTHPIFTCVLNDRVLQVICVLPPKFWDYRVSHTLSFPRLITASVLQMKMSLEVRQVGL